MANRDRTCPPFALAALALRQAREESRTGELHVVQPEEISSGVRGVATQLIRDPPNHVGPSLELTRTRENLVATVGVGAGEEGSKVNRPCPASNWTLTSYPAAVEAKL
jgi:hypothetical protein